MSRDALGSGAVPPGAAVPAPTAGPGAPDDLAEGAGASPGPRPARPGGRTRRRRAAALLLAAAVGAGGALLAVRAHDAADVRLLLVSAFPDVAAPAGVDEVSVDLGVVGLGGQDATVLDGGSGPPGGGVEGSVGVADAGWLPRERAGEPPVVPAGGVEQLVLRLEASCEDPPPWRPWLRVRTASGGERVVRLEAAERAAPARDVVAEACEYRQESALSPVSVVGHGTDDGGVALTLSNTSPVRYRVEVGAGGISGLSLADGGVELPPGRTTSLVLDVDPPRCAGALRVDDLVSDAGVRVERTEGGDDDGPAVAPLDLWVAQTEVALAVGRACADS